MNKKSVLFRKVFQQIGLMFTALVLTLTSFAQDKKVDVDISTDKGGSGFWG